MTKAIDHSRGRIELLNGDMFYSPNPPMSGGLVVLPQYHDPELHIFTFDKHGKPCVQWDDFLLPRWFASRTAFLPFLTPSPITTGYPFNWLARIPAQDCTDGKYSLKEEGRDSWLKLEQDLILGTAYIRRALQLPLFVDRPFSPMAFGSLWPPATPDFAKLELVRGRGVFQIKSRLGYTWYTISCQEVTSG